MDRPFTTFHLGLGIGVIGLVFYIYLSPYLGQKIQDDKMLKKMSLIHDVLHKLLKKKCCLYMHNLDAFHACIFRGQDE
jgi:hypothetical protein